MSTGALGWFVACGGPRARGAKRETIDAPRALCEALCDEAVSRRDERAEASLLVLTAVRPLVVLRVSNVLWQTSGTGLVART